MKMLACVVALMVAVGGAAGCKGKSSSSGNGLAKLSEFKDAMCKCKDSACAQDVSAKMTAWTQEQARGDHPSKMSDADTAKAQEISDALGKCMATAMTANAAGSAAAGSAAAGSAAGSAAIDPAAFADLPQACQDYRKAVDRLRTCGDKLPAEVRDTMLEQFDKTAQGWVKLPAEGKKSLAPACEAGMKAVLDNSKECGP